MQPIQHRSNNDVLRAPLGVPVEECRPLAITRVKYGDGSHGVWSYWQPSEAERAAIAAGAAVRLEVVGGTHPPLWVGVDRVERP